MNELFKDKCNLDGPTFIYTKSVARHPVVIAAIMILLGLGFAAQAQTIRRISTSAKKETIKMNHISGAFEVKTIPQKTDNNEAESAKISRMSLDKEFLGDLKATSKGEMIFTGTDVEGSGVYVALERVTGTLGGRSGTFVLYHTGVMTRGAPHLSVSVLPDSGTGELAGLSGKMDIKIEGGKHFYEFEYSISEVH